MDGLLTPRFMLAWAVSFFSGLAFFLFVHFPGFLEDLGATEVQIGVVVGVTAFAAHLIRPSIGRELDPRGRPRCGARRGRGASRGRVGHDRPGVRRRAGRDVVPGGDAGR